MSTQSKNEWNRKNYDRVLLVLPAGSKARFQAVASEMGMSLNNYILNHCSYSVFASSDLSEDYKLIARYPFSARDDCMNYIRDLIISGNTGYISIKLVRFYGCSPSVHEWHLTTDGWQEF